jgi:transposase InsO family protein
VTAFFFPKSKSEEVAKRENFSAKSAKWDASLCEIRDFNAETSDKYSPKTEEIMEKFFNKIEKEFNLLKSKMSEDGLG